jgi:hypothetical protein
MRKIIAALLFSLSLAIPIFSQAAECTPQMKPDFQLNTGGFDSQAYQNANKPAEDSAGTVQVCFLSSSQPGLSPTSVFDNLCGCKEEIKKHCSITKKGKIKGNGVPQPWCVPFGPFL